MPSPGRLAGISSFFVDGVPITTKGEMEFQTSTTKREKMVDMGGRFIGWTETGEPPYMGVTVINDGTMTSGAMYALTNIQCVAELANGGTVTGHSMTMMDQPEVNADEASFKIKFLGVSVEESY